MKSVSLSDIQKFKEKDEESFEKIYEVYKNIVFHECLIKLKNKEDAEDCFQEIFIKLIKVINQFDEEIASFDTWFKVVYTNHIKNYIRNSKNRKKYSEPIEYEEMIKYEDKTSKYIDKMIEINNLVGEEAYKIILLKVRYQLTLRKIAQIMGVSKDTVRRKYLDAIEIIKENYQKEK